MTVELHHGNCLDIQPTLDGPFDAIIADLPYGTTACKWDMVIPFEPLWEQYKRLIKPKGAIVLFGSQPFTSALVMSNPEWFKYCWVWKKSKPTGFLNAKVQPLRQTEDIAVFYGARCTYNPQGTSPTSKMVSRTNRGNYGACSKTTLQTVTGYPRNILGFPSIDGDHPTQKPVALLEYLIKTYTNEGETVLDNTMGSGTTGVACVNTGRNFVGIELDAGYFEIAQQRIEKAQSELVQETLL